MGSRSLAVACIVAAGCALAGCGGRQDRVRPRPAVVADWRSVATDADRERLRRWRETWLTALAQVRDRGFAGAIAPLGPLLDPDRAQGGAMPPPGNYRCRVFKLGSKTGSGTLAYVSYPFFDCRIDTEGEVLSFHKETGSQRPVGLLFRDSDTRAVFLGTMLLGDERSALQYGQDATRDMAGYIERVADRRWRLVLPAPAFESLLDVVELIPR